MTKNIIKSTDKAKYEIERTISMSDDEILNKAMIILKKRLMRFAEAAITKTGDAKQFCALMLRNAEVEEFGIMFLDQEHKLLQACIMFRGTLTRSTIYPREIMAKAIELKASALILFHNHPSGSKTFSADDVALTRTLIDAFRPFDIRILDHVLSPHGHDPVSMAERPGLPS